MKNLFFFFNWKSCLVFFIFQTFLKSYFSLVKAFNFLILFNFFVSIHRCWLQNFPLKNMTNMLGEIFCCFWVFVSISMLIVLVSFTCVIFLYRNRLSRKTYIKNMDFSPSKGKLFGFLCFPNNSEIILFCENIQFL